VRVSWAYRPATALMPISTSTIRIHPRGRAKSSLPPRRCCGPCPPLQRLRRGTCTARRRRSSSKRPSSRPKARRPASASRGTREAMGARRGPNPRYTRVEQRSAPPTRGAHRRRSGSSTRAGKHGRRCPQRHQRSADEQSGRASGSRLPPSAGRTLR
jgi:hypothetical protein